MDRRRFGRFLTGLAIAASIAGLVALGLDAGWLESLRARSSDAVVFPRRSAAEEVAVVAIDARSVAARQAPWPWTRDAQADLVTAITAAGATVVVLDVVLAPATDSDDRLAAALRETRSVIAAAVESTTADDRQWTDQGVLIATNVIAPEPRFAEVASVGHSAVTPDGSDGVTRRVPLVIESDRRFLPALSIAALAKLDGVAPQVTVRDNAVQIGQRAIPTDERHQLRVSYSASLSDDGDLAVVSAIDVLEGRVGDRLRNKVVFVGVTDPIAGDRFLTPIAKRSGMAGVLVHANAFHTISTRTYLAEADDAEVVAWAFALALLVSLVVLLLKPWVGAVVAIGAAAAFVVFVIARADRGTIVDVAFPVLATAAALVLTALVRELLVDRQRRQLATLFGQYVPPSVAREVVGDARASGVLDGRSMHVTVLFCDIRNFTPLTAPLEPPQIRVLLDTYYSVLSGVVLAHGGTVLRYTGDEILAVFGAPRASLDHAVDAVRAAMALHASQADLADRLASAGLPAFGYGIGLQSGEVVSAVMGSEVRRQYAVIGSPLTLGARLCAEAREGEIVVSHETFSALDNPPPAESFIASLKGRTEPVVAYRIVSAS